MINKTFDKFPLGFWGHYHGYNMPDESHVKDWHDCGMTLTMSPSYNDKNEMLKFMDLCHKYDIKLILCDARIGWRRGNSRSWAAASSWVPSRIRSQRPRAI